MTYDTPIDEIEFLVRQVVDIDEYRLARGKSRHGHDQCEHKKLVYDKEERRIWCQDCQSTIDNFDIVMALIEPIRRAQNELKDRKKEVQDLVSANIIRVAAKNLDNEWQKRNTVPCCPHCKDGLLPEDFYYIKWRVSKEIARQKRKHNDT